MEAKNELEIWGTQESEVPCDSVALLVNGHKAAYKKPTLPHSLAGDSGVCTAKKIYRHYFCDGELCKGFCSWCCQQRSWIPVK